MHITIQKPSKKGDTKECKIVANDAMTVEQLKEMIAVEFKVPPNSQALKFANTKWKEGDSKGDKFVRLNKLLETVGELKAKGLSPSVPVELKNLGTQVPYRWFFLTEYFGPMPIMAYLSTRPELIYGKGANDTPLPMITTLAVYAFILHFVKRELETLFVHKFSKPSVPVFNIVRNSAYYWGFAAAVAYFVCHPQATAVDDNLGLIALGGMAVMELGNLAVHLWFSMQRKADKDAARPVPAGALFFVSCPNYFFEIAAWCFFSVMVNNNLASWAFTLVGGGQMALWAMDRHKAYVKQEKKEGGPPVARRRSALVPFLW